jgi:Flp pilus assembly pilin Flp
MMLRLRNRTSRKTRTGATATEYGLLSALIAVVVIAAVTSLGSLLGLNFWVLYNVMRDGDITEPGEAMYEQVWQFGHGGDELMTEDEFVDFYAIIDPMNDEAAFEFPFADSNGDTFVDYGEWIDYADLD